MACEAIGIAWLKTMRKFFNLDISIVSTKKGRKATYHYSRDSYMGSFSPTTRIVMEHFCKTYVSNLGVLSICSFTLMKSPLENTKVKGSLLFVFLWPFDSPTLPSLVCLGRTCRATVNWHERRSKTGSQLENCRKIVIQAREMHNHLHFWWMFMLLMRFSGISPAIIRVFQFIQIPVSVFLFHIYVHLLEVCCAMSVLNRDQKLGSIEELIGSFWFTLARGPSLTQLIGIAAKSLDERSSVPSGVNHPQYLILPIT